MILDSDDTFDAVHGAWCFRSLMPRRSRRRGIQFDTLGVRPTKFALRIETVTKSIRLHPPQSVPEQAILGYILARLPCQLRLAGEPSRTHDVRLHGSPHRKRRRSLGGSPTPDEYPLIAHQLNPTARR
jgi:hypothetical protein